MSNVNNNADRAYWVAREPLTGIENDGDFAGMDVATALAGRECPPKEHIVERLIWNADWRAKLKVIRADAQVRALSAAHNAYTAHASQPAGQIYDALALAVKDVDNLRAQVANMHYAAAQLSPKENTRFWTNARK